MNLDNYFPIGQALVQLMNPLVEVVIHSLSTKKIVFIAGKLSQRSVGHDSLIEDDILTMQVEVYGKLNFDGKLIRSISIPLKQDDTVIGFMCINYDVSIMHQMHDLTQLLLQTPLHQQPQALFKNDWQDKIHQKIHQIVQEKKLKFDELSNQQKQEIIYQLYIINAFYEKNAAEYIAKIFDLSRATIFNYLRKYKQGGEYETENI